jgi:hypothetical protein
MALIIKLTNNFIFFGEMEEYQKAWDFIKRKYVEVSILIHQSGMFKQMHHYWYIISQGRVIN